MTRLPGLDASLRFAGPPPSGGGAERLSVVVASVNGLPYLEACLRSLSEYAAAAEVVVADWTDDATRGHVRERWPAAQLLSFSEPMAVPELRAAGIAATTRPYVAVIEDHCVVRAGWGDRIVAAHERGHSVVGGPIVNGMTERLRDWAAFYCEYSEHMEPVADGPTTSLVGMNVSYDRPALDAMAGLLAEGRWETWLHPHLLSQGFEFWSDSTVVLDHVKDFGFRDFAEQRYHYARSHAGMRNPSLGPKRIVYVVGSPLIVPLMFRRIAGNVWRRPAHRRRFVLVTPLLVVYLGIWAAGEAVGYALGGGRSLLRVR